MNALDLAICVSIIGSFLRGYRRGFVARVVLYATVLAVVVIAVRNLSTLVNTFGRGNGHVPPVRLGAVLFGALFIAQILGSMIGRWVRNRLPTRPLRKLDHVAGGMVGPIAMMASIALVGPILGLIPGRSSALISGSLIVRNVVTHVPHYDAVKATRRMLDNTELSNIAPMDEG